MDRKSILRSLLAVTVLGLIVYSNALNGEFIWDDGPLVQENLLLRSWSHLPIIFTEDIGAGSGSEYNFYRPLQTFTYLIDFSLWGLGSQGYHLTNILLHIVVASVIFWLISILFKNYLLSLVTSILFVIHPVHSEAVAYISGRPDILAALFLLLSITFYVSYYEKGRVPLLIYSLASYIAALLSKEYALILPVLILLYHYGFHKEMMLKSLLPIVFVTIIYIVVRSLILRDVLPDLSLYPPLLKRLPTALVALTHYLRLLIFPFPLHMEYGTRFFSIGNPAALMGLVIISIGLVVLCKTRTRNTLIFFGVGWFLVSLLPVSHIYPLNAYMAEHWLYIPSIGLLLLIAKGLEVLYITPQFKKTAAGLAVVLVLTYSVLTIRQNHQWSSPITFFERTLHYAPESTRIINNLGNAYAAKGRHDDALAQYRRAIAIDPDNVKAHYNLGFTYAALGEDNKAIEWYERTIEIDKTYAKAYNNLGNIYSNRGDIERALSLYKRAVALYPRYVEALYNTGNELGKTENNKDAITYYKRALEINPSDGAIHNNLAVAYYYENQLESARRHCDRAIAFGVQPHPDFLKALSNY